MIACGLLLGNKTFRKRMVEVNQEIPGTASDDWQVACAIADEPSAEGEFAAAKVGNDDSNERLAADTRLMRAFVRCEIDQRLRHVELLCTRYRTFLPHEAADQRKLRGELEDLLIKLQENE